MGDYFLQIYQKNFYDETFSKVINFKEEKFKNCQLQHTNFL